jgi:hypothetical protein
MRAFGHQESWAPHHRVAESGISCSRSHERTALRTTAAADTPEAMAARSSCSRTLGSSWNANLPVNLPTLASISIPLFMGVASRSFQGFRCMYSSTAFRALRRSSSVKDLGC